MQQLLVSMYNKKKKNTTTKQANKHKTPATRKYALTNMLNNYLHYFANKWCMLLTLYTQ